MEETGLNLHHLLLFENIKKEFKYQELINKYSYFYFMNLKNNLTFTQRTITTIYIN